MKRIVIDARQLKSSSGRYVENLLANLQQVDTDLKHQYIVLLKPADMDAWNPTSKRFKKVACPYKEFTFSEQLLLLIQLYRLRPNLVHFAFAQQPILYLGKTVTTMHDLTTLRFYNPSKNRIVFTVKQKVYKYVNIIAARKSSAVITPTEFVKDDVARFANLNSRKITVTLESGDSIAAKPVAIPELENKQFIMYVGRPQPHKNLTRLIDAFALLAENHPDLYLVLVGKEDTLFRRHARYVKKLGLQNVVFTGFVDDPQLRWLFEHTSAYLFPSLSEGFGLPGLEAMNHGAPVVSSNATCLPEVYGDAAHYFHPLDVEGMSKAINDVLTKPQLKEKLIAAGYKQIKKYSWKRMAEQTLTVYKSVLKES